MNKLNFDSLRNISVPEEWIENALKIPKNNKSKKHEASVRIRRIIALAACFMLVGVISIPVFVFESYKMTVPIAPPFQTNDIENSNGQTSGLSDSTELADPTEEAKNQESEVSAPSYTDPTEVLTSSPKDPTEPFTEATKPPAPTRPKPTNPRPTIPTNLTGTQPNTGNYVSMVPSCSGSYLMDGYASIDSVGEVYCRLYDSFGNLVGDPNLYSYEHKAEEDFISNGYIFVSYDPTEKGLRLQRGTYGFCFYLDDGRVVFRGNITVT